jgi:Zn-finger nucleic acid-binding protein
MKCPIDNENLVMTDRNGVEIDYCPQCRGVWLDRGELDKIIERSAAPTPQADDRGFSNDQRSRDDHRRNKPKKKSSLLGELFDF